MVRPPSQPRCTINISPRTGPRRITRRPRTLLRRLRGILALALVAGTPLLSPAAEFSSTTNAPSRVIESSGTVEVQLAGATSWQVATNGLSLKPGDRVRTGIESRAAVQLSDRSVLRLGSRTTLEIQLPRHQEKRRFGLKDGVLYFFNRERPSDVEFETPIVAGAIRGTEFVLEAATASTATTRLALVDGHVQLTSADGSLALQRGEEALFTPGQTPVRSPLLNTTRTIQWALYYPAVVHPDDLDFTADDRTLLAPSLGAYQSGDLLAALREVLTVPAGSPARETYRAALELAVGSVAACERRLAALPQESPAVRALQELIRVVRGEPRQAASAAATVTTPSELLANSYRLQSEFRLTEALRAARLATERAPGSGYAQVRTAELLRAFDDHPAALAALDKALELAPRLAQAHSLRGFVLLETRPPDEAVAAFEKAIALDAALSSAWLGKGTAFLRLGRRSEALELFQAAAALDPTRSIHRSYLARAYSLSGQSLQADKELRLARELDPADPTPSLYGALHAWSTHRPNAALAALEHSVELNDNQQLFRSRLLLDRDLAVRSANLASLYRDAGLPELSLATAARALAQDHTSFSAHLFAANSYQALENPNRFDLRYESARQSELLVANLLAPPGAGNLSHLVSQQDHRMFAEFRPVGGGSLTEIRSNGDWKQQTSLFGSTGGFGYALDGSFVSREGDALNDWQDRRDLSLQVKQRFTSHDDAYFQVGVVDADYGDIARHHDPASAKAGFQAAEQQLPNLTLGWHRAWSPTHHSLLLVSRFTDDLELHDPEPGILFLRQDATGISAVSTPPLFEVNYSSGLTLYTAELQHLWKQDAHSLVLGARGQSGDLDPASQILRPLTGRVTNDSFDQEFHRLGAYAYYQVRLNPAIQLIAGITQDHLTHPANSEFPPLTDTTVHHNQISPKAGAVFTPWRDGLLRAAYTKALGGVFFDNSIRLEPTQVAGFTQTYRSLLPESASGAIPGAAFETLNLGLDQKLWKHTYIGLRAEELRSEGTRTLGVLTNSLPLPIPDSPSSTPQQLDFRERTLSLYAVQLVGDGTSLGLRYHLSEAHLETRYPDLPPTATGWAALHENSTSLLHQLTASLGYQHPSGLFGRWETTWFHQDNDGYSPTRADEALVQHDLFLGYHWPRRRAELRLGLLNLTDADYRLSPLNPYAAPPRNRTAVATLRVAF